MKLVITITCGAFDPARMAACEALRAELQTQCDAHGVTLLVHEDREAKGSLLPWIRTLTAALALEPTHVTLLPDDAILVPHFVETLLAVIAAKPDAIIDLIANHPEAAKLAESARWYTTAEGFVGFGGTMPASWWRAYLAWRERALQPKIRVEFDEGVNLWALLSARQIHRPLPSLADHRTDLPSLDGNDAGPSAIAHRQSACFRKEDLRAIDWHGPTTAFGRTTKGKHWEAIFNVRPEFWDIEAVYRANRYGKPVSAAAHVLICTPAYNPPELAFLSTREFAVRELGAAGIKATVITTNGDSLVTRGRHAIMHEFLCSDATHLLQWDADLELLTPKAIASMVQSGYDVVGGAYPFRDGSGRVVINLRLEDMKAGVIEVDEGGFMKLAEIGTGFLLTTRRAIVDLCKTNPDRLYESDMEPHRECPMWALFDARFAPHPIRPERMRYLSEDWEFCRLWRARGGDVWCYTGAEFRHWGKVGHEGTIQKALHMQPVKEAAE